MSKNVNNDVTMNPPVLDPLLCRHENLSGYIVKRNCTRLEQVVHTHQTSVRCTKYQSSLPSQQGSSRRFYSFTSATVRIPVHIATKRDRRLSGICQSTSILAQCSVVPLQKSSLKSLLLCVITWFFVSTQELSGIVSEHSLNKKGKSLQLQLQVNTRLTCPFHFKPQRMRLFVVYFLL